jgi:ribosomal protein S6--L-glutamate ligase
MGIALVNDHGAVSIARNKFLTQQKLCAANLPCPATVFINDSLGFRPAVEYLGGYPVVVKAVSARQGEGVMLVKDEGEAPRRVLPALDRRQGMMVQRYMPPDGRRDIRVLIVGGKAVCAACLTPQKGEFRANFHLGGDIRAMDLSADLAEPAVAATKVVGCDVAGVDMMVGKDGLPQIIEVNYSPGFRGMEAASGLDVARRMIDLSIKKYRKK